jgi:hypothetical protein
MSLQGTFTWPGLTHVKSARYTQTHGTEPDDIVVECEPGGTVNATEFGNAFFYYSNLQVPLLDCKIKSSRLRIGDSGQFIHIRIQDRRWRWKYGEVSGEYNVTDSDGSYVAHIKKNAQELAVILLNAMGEYNIDVSGLPTDQWPERQWVCSNPTNELDKLCDQYGCRVVLGIGTDPVTVQRLGVGTPLPPVARINIDAGITSSDMPDHIAVCGDRILYDGVFTLEPIGIEFDGSLKHIDDLSYRPEAGWVTDDFSNLRFPLITPDLTEEERRRAQVLAERAIFRWYRPVDLKGIWAGSGSVPYSSANVVSINQFDIQPYRTGSADGGLGYKVKNPSLVYGSHIRIQSPNQVAGKEGSSALPFDIVPYQSSIGKDDIVRFNEKIVTHLGTDKFSVLTAPSLFLHAGFFLRDYDTWLEQRWRWARQTRNPPIGTGTLPIHTEALKYEVSFNYLTDSQGYLTSTGTEPVYLGTATENSEQLISASEDLIDGVIPKFSSSFRASATYVGLQPIRPNGLIRQVTWQVTDGSTGSIGGVSGNAFTLASLNSETDPYVKGYRIRRSNAVAEAIEANKGRISDRRNYNAKVRRKGRD